MRWRPTLFSLHRDIGFVCVGLTLVYAVSGVAVNHRHHWNYNQSTTIELTRVGSPAELLTDLPASRREELTRDPTSLRAHEEEHLVRHLGAALGRSQAPKNAFWRDPRRLSLFYDYGDADTVNYDAVAGTAEHLVKRDRWLLRDLNFLHLNEQKGLWTYLADTYAVLLAFLALSGAILVKGRRGLKGRGGVLLGVGVAVPIVALIWAHYG